MRFRIYYLSVWFRLLEVGHFGWILMGFSVCVFLIVVFIFIYCLAFYYGGIFRSCCVGLGMITGTACLFPSISVTLFRETKYVF